VKSFSRYSMAEAIGNILYLVRGLPGSGKSTYAKTLVPTGAHFEADQYFMKGQKYDFDPTKLKDAHAECLARTHRAMKSGNYKAVAVSNTFTMKWEMQPYIDLAKSLGWTLQVIRTTGKYKSIHGVPQDSIDRMQSRFEPFAGEVIK